MLHKNVRSITFIVIFVLCVTSNLVSSDSFIKSCNPFIELNQINNSYEGQISTVTLSPDLQRYAYTVSNEKLKFVVVDGTSDSSYDKIHECIYFSEDSKHYAYVAQKGWDWFIVHDGQQSKAYKSIQTYTRTNNKDIFSINGDSVALWTQNKDGIWGWGVMGVKGSFHHPVPSKIPKINAMTFYLSPDHEHTGYIKQGYNKSSRIQRPTCTLFIDGNELNSYQIINNFSFGPTMGKYAFVGRESPSDYKSKVVNVNGNEYGPYLSIRSEPTFYGNNGELVVFCATKDNLGSQYININGKDCGPYKSNNGIVIYKVSPDEKRCAYVANRGNKSFVFKDGVEYGPYRSVESLTFSPDSNRLAYVIRIHLDKGEDRINTEIKHLIVDGNEVGSYDEIDMIIFSHDSRHFAVSGKDNNIPFVSVDGKKGPPEKRIPRYIQFNPTSNSVAYIADGRLKIDFKDVCGLSNSFCFSKNGQHLLSLKNQIYVNGAKVESNMPYRFINLPSQIVDEFNPVERLVNIMNANNNQFLVVGLNNISDIYTAKLIYDYIPNDYNSKEGIEVNIDNEVYITPTADGRRRNTYHRTRSCGYIKPGTRTESISLEDAKHRRYSPCSTCCAKRFDKNDNIAITDEIEGSGLDVKAYVSKGSASRRRGQSGRRRTEFHSDASCRSLKQSEDLMTISLEEAVDRNYFPCKACCSKALVSKYKKIRG